MANILLIDDDAQVRQVLLLLLTEAGHAVTVAGDGKEGMALFRAEPADLVITDIVMPNEEGLETIVKLRREFPALGIIAMSGNTLHSPTWLKVAALLGANQTLAKPFSLSRFTEAVAQVLATNPRNRKTVLQPVSGLSPIDS